MSTMFLGVVISPSKPRMEPAKLQAVNNLPALASQRDLKEFLGYTTFYRYPIRGHSSVTALLMPQNSSNICLCWNMKAKRPFVLMSLLSQISSWDNKLPPCGYTDWKEQSFHSWYGLIIKTLCTHRLAKDSMILNLDGLCSY